MGGSSEPRSSAGRGIEVVKNLQRIVQKTERFGDRQAYLDAESALARSRGIAHAVCETQGCQPDGGLELREPRSVDSEVVFCRKESISGPKLELLFVARP